MILHEPLSLHPCNHSVECICNVTVMFSDDRSYAVAGFVLLKTCIINISGAVVWCVVAIDSLSFCCHV